MPVFHRESEPTILYFIGRIVNCLVMRLAVSIVVVAFTGMLVWQTVGGVSGEKGRQRIAAPVNMSRFYKGSKFITPADGVDSSSVQGKVWYSVGQ